MITQNVNGQAISQAFIYAITDSTTPYLMRFMVDEEELQCSLKKATITKGSCGSMENFTTGAVISSQLVAEVKDLSIDVKGKTIDVQIGLNGEFISLGKFVVTEAPETVYATNITAYGFSVSQTSGAFKSPQDIGQSMMLGNIASQIEDETGLDIIVDDNIDMSQTLDVPITGISNYQALQILASVVAGYAIDTWNGNIALKSYKGAPDLSIEVGRMKTLPQSEKSDFEVTGVSVNTIAGAINSSTPINLVCNAEYLTFDMFSKFESNIVGYKYRPAKCNITLGDPRIEGSDVVEIIDVDGSTYNVPCHSVIHTYTGGGLTTQIQSATASQLENEIATTAPISGQLDGIRNIANEALEAVKDIGNTSQYFWHTTTDTGAGAGSHVTQLPQQEFLTDPDNGGGNTLIDSTGMKVRDGLKDIAQFGENTRVGYEGKGGVSMSSDGMTVYDGDGVEAMSVNATTETETKTITQTGTLPFFPHVQEESTEVTETALVHTPTSAISAQIKFDIDTQTYDGQATVALDGTTATMQIAVSREDIRTFSLSYKDGIVYCECTGVGMAQSQDIYELSLTYDFLGYIANLDLAPNSRKSLITMSKKTGIIRTEQEEEDVTRIDDEGEEQVIGKSLQTFLRIENAQPITGKYDVTGVLLDSYLDDDSVAQVGISYMAEEVDDEDGNPTVEKVPKFEVLLATNEFEESSSIDMTTDTFGLSVQNSSIGAGHLNGYSDSINLQAGENGINILEDAAIELTAPDVYISIDEYAESGTTDYKIVQALKTLGWYDDCIVDGSGDYGEVL